MISARLLLAVALLAAGPAAAQVDESATSAAGGEIRALDKIAGKTQDIHIGKGETAQVFRLDVTLGDCRYPTEDPSSDAFAQLTIRDRGTVVFDGWMVSSSPALSALDHPRYDIWVLRCDLPRG